MVSLVIPPEPCPCRDAGESLWILAEVRVYSEPRKVAVDWHCHYCGGEEVCTFREHPGHELWVKDER